MPTYTCTHAHTEEEGGREGERERERVITSCSLLSLFFWLVTGHQQLVVDVSFSPDARLIASASFDKSVKLWEAKTGK